jgi:dTDP-4-dehydrorhamnose 3,5-epimerase
MRFVPTGLPDAFLVKLEPHRDERGFFARTFCEDEFAKAGLPTRFPQSNLSHNARAGTLRGMHYNAAPHREAKLVRCTAGAIWDVIADLRKESPARFQWFGVELDAESGDALFIPEGFAHGFITLRDGTDVTYQMGRSFVAGAARGLRWDDPKLDIRWPRKPEVLNEKDASWPAFDEASFDG